MVSNCKDWLINILLGIDQLGNTIVGGDPDETISSRLGRLKIRCGGQIPWGRYPVARLLDICLDKIDKNHCVDAIEPWTQKKSEDKIAETSKDEE